MAPHKVEPDEERQQPAPLGDSSNPPDGEGLYTMDVVCEKCSAIYELDLAQIQGPSVRVKCSSCGHMFRVFKSEAESPSTSGVEILNEWMIRYKDGASAQVPDLATLQRWIIEGKIARTDELSRDGKNWQILGQVADLVPFFQLVEKLGAATVNTPQPETSTSISISTMSPRATLEFGYGNDDSGDSDEATEFALQGAPDPEATEFALQSAPDDVAVVPLVPINAPENGSQMPPPAVVLSAPSSLPENDEQVNVPTEIGLVSASIDNLPGNAPNKQDGIPIAVKEPTNHQLPSNLAPGASGEWFMASDAVAVDPNEPQLSHSNDQLRDFSTFSDYAAPSGDYDEHDDFHYAPSNRGRTFAIIFLILAIVLGGLYVFQPKLFSKVAVSLGLIDEDPDARQKVEEARLLWTRLTPKVFSGAKKLLQEAASLQGKSFTTQRASLAQLSLFKAEYHLLKLALQKQKIEGLRKKEKELTTALKQIDPKDPEKEQKEQALQGQLKPLSTAVDKAGDVLRKLNDVVEKHRNDAKTIIDELRSIKQPHPYILLGVLHLISMSTDSEAFEKSLKKTKAALSKYPQHQTFFSLLKAAHLNRKEKWAQSETLLTGIIAKEGGWILPRMLRAAGLAAQHKNIDAKAVLNSLLSVEKGHPLALWYLRNLTPPPPPRPVTPPTQPETPRNTPEKRPAPRRDPVVAGDFKSLFRRAERLRMRERIRPAYRYYLRALKLKKTSRVFSGIGWCQLDMKRIKSAERSFLTAMKYSKRNGSAYYGLGLVYRRRQKKSKARNMLNEYLKRFPRGRDAGEVRLILRSLK